MSKKAYFPHSLAAFKENIFLRCHPFPESVFENSFYDLATSDWLSNHANADSQLLNLSTHPLGQTSPPACVIFHIARCGSTLVSKFFSLSSRYRVVREPQVVNTLLSESWSKQDKEKTFNQLIQQFSQSGGTSAPSLVLKTTSWNMFEVAFFRNTLPKTPFLFVYRDPVEVMSSIIKEPHGMLRKKNRNPDLFGSFLDVSPEAIMSMSSEEYVALTLKTQFRLMIDLKTKVKEENTDYNSQNCFFISYTNLVKKSKILFSEQFGFNPTEVVKMRDLSKLNAKTAAPVQFKEDSTVKQLSISEKALAFLHKCEVHKYWQELESLNQVY